MNVVLEGRDKQSWILKRRRKLNELSFEQLDRELRRATRRLREAKEQDDKHAELKGEASRATAIAQIECSMVEDVLASRRAL